MPTKKIKVHFIGIGGIGVSALAQYYLAQGHQVSGSDLVGSEITQALKKKGVKVFIGQHKKENVPQDVDLIIYSPAVPKNNPELVKGSRTSVMSYPQALGALTKEHFTIAISGTHGKTTTCAMVGLILIKAGFDPTVIVGTKVKEFGDSNFRLGKSKYLVIEACEYDKSFLNYHPQIIVITNIEAEHLDYFKTFQNVLKAFRQFVKKLPQDGILIDEEKYLKVSPAKRDETGDEGKLRRRQTSLTAKDASRLKKILKVPGAYNVANALAALAVARALKIEDKTSYQALADYQGSWRRFEQREVRGLTVVSDYGHHPTQIKATLRAARDKWPKRKIWCVFQPHQYQRTYYLFNDFVRVFKQAPVDKLMITDIYDVAGREETKIKKQVSAEKLIISINKKWASFVAKDQIINYLKKNLKGAAVVIFMGAGNIYEVDKKFK